MTNIFKNNLFFLSYFFIFIFAFCLRFIDLGNRAVHHDESLHGYFSYIISQGDYYHHNPLTHGMFLFNVLATLFWLMGSNEIIMRLPFAIVGLTLIFIPILLKEELGKRTVLFISLFLAISPSITYFSRFARNDIFMAFIIIFLFVSVYKYLNESKNIWLFITVALTAIGFTIKESMYLNIFGILLFLFLYSFVDLKNVLLGKISIKNIKPITKLFLMISLLCLPLAAPLLSIFQSSIGVILATPDSYPGIPPGLPIGNGIFVSIIITLILVIFSMFFGFIIDKKLWLYSFSIFFIIYTLMFTSFFVNPNGLITGHWQSLGYWLSQHDVARGSQPYYYYILILMSNEFLYFVFGFPISLYFLYKGTLFEKFVSFIGIYSLIAFSIAGEKMPWLILNISIPFVFTLSLFLNRIMSNFHKPKEILILYFVSSIVFIFLILRLIFTDYSKEDNFLYYDLLFLIIAIAVLFLYIAYNKNLYFPKTFFSSILIVMIILSTLLTIRTTNKIVFELSDEPYDLLIYTQTSKAMHEMNQEINKSYFIKEDLSVGIDTLDGYAWPWMWYLRGKNNVIWTDISSFENYEFDYLLINEKNLDNLPPEFINKYQVKRKIPHRKWFPESLYREKNLSDISNLLTDTNNRQLMRDYYLYRKIPIKLGHTNAVLLKSKEFESIE